MYKVSEIISTPIISLYESEYIGIIYNITFDNKQKKCKYALILNENDNIPKIMKFSDIYKFGKECIFIKNKIWIELEDNYTLELTSTLNPINLNVYSLKGENLGNVTDIVLDKTLCIDKIILSNSSTIDNKNIFNMSKSIILIDNNKINISKFKPKEKVINNPENNTKVMILKTPNIATDETKTPNNTLQNKIITDSRFLIGRVLNKDIIALNGEIVAKTGNKITNEIISKASSYGKLLEIARFSEKI